MSFLDNFGEEPRDESWNTVDNIPPVLDVEGVWQRPIAPTPEEGGEDTEPGFYQTFIPVLFACAVAALVGALFFSLVHPSTEVALLVTGGLLLVALWWAFRAMKADKEDQPSEAHLRIRIHYLCNVSVHEAVSMLSFLFTPDPDTGVIEEEVLSMVKRHRAWMFLHSGPLVLGAIAIVVLLESSLARETASMPEDLNVPSDASTLVVLVCMVIMLVNWLNWRSRYYVFTTNEVYLVRKFTPAWAWLGDDEQHMSLISAKVGGMSRTFVARVFLMSYGTLKFESSSQEDEAFHKLRWIPEVDVLEGYLQVARRRQFNA